MSINLLSTNKYFRIQSGKPSRNATSKPKFEIKESVYDCVFISYNEKNETGSPEGSRQKSVKTSLFEMTIDDREIRFWNELIKKYLFPEKPNQEKKVYFLHLDEI